MSVIDDHLKDATEPERLALEHVRNLVQQAAPEAVEVITYSMPGFYYKDTYLISFASFKNHLSIFPGDETIAALQDRLTEFKTSKGTIQFTLEHPLPDNLVRDIVKQRVQEIESKAQRRQ